VKWSKSIPGSSRLISCYGAMGKSCADGRSRAAKNALL
jgi:hypothetical protein